MFLKQLRVLRDDRERGSALMGVIGVMAVTVLIAATVSGVSLNSANVTTAGRAEVQARAAADAGIDVAFERIARGDFQCLVGPRPGDPRFAVQVEYFVGGVEQACSGAFGGAPEDARITSTGSPENVATGGSGVNHTVVAEVDITVTPGSGTSLPFNKAVFTDGQLTIATNDVDFLESELGAADADMYSNGTYVCRTQVDIQGTIHAQQDLRFENNCKITGDVWAKGTIGFSSEASVRGNVFSAGTGTVNLGGGHFDGNVISNSSVILNTSSGKKDCPYGGPVRYTVCGSVVALGGGVSISNEAGIGRYLVAKGNIHIDQAGSNVIVGADAYSTTGSLTLVNAQTGNIRGAARIKGAITVNNKTDAATVSKSIVGVRCSNNGCTPPPSLKWPDAGTVLPPELGYPTTDLINGPPRESMPKVASDTAAIDSWKAEGWQVMQFLAPVGGKSTCEQAKSYLLTSPTPTAPATGILVIVRNCPEPIKWVNTTLTLKTDIAVMSTSGFSADNDNTIKSDSPTVERDLMWIVPSDAPAVAWKDVPGQPGHWRPECTGTTGDINMGSSNYTLTRVNWLVYSPCLVDFGNKATGFAGQVYSGRIGDFPATTQMQYAPMNVPGATVPGGGAPTTGTSTAVITARYDAAR